MLRRSDQAKVRKQKRCYERVSLRLQAPNEYIPQYQYIPPPMEPHGTSIATGVDIYRSTNDISSTTTEDSTSDKDTSDGSISIYTIKLYNCLEGGWGNCRPSPLHQQKEFDQYQEEEEDRLAYEPHQLHLDT